MSELTSEQAAALLIKTKQYADNVHLATCKMANPSRVDLLLRDTINVCCWQQDVLANALARIEALEAANRLREGGK